MTGAMGGVTPLDFGKEAQIVPVPLGSIIPRRMILFKIAVVRGRCL